MDMPSGSVGPHRLGIYQRDALRGAGVKTTALRRSLAGLPSNTVRDVVVLSAGTKAFATAVGLARYEGP